MRRWMDNFQTYLSVQGLRHSKRREQVARVFFSMSKHVGIEDLYAAVSRAAARASEGLRRRLERRRSGRPSTGRGRSRDEPPGGRAHDAPVPRRELGRELRGADRITEQLTPDRITEQPQAIRSWSTPRRQRC